MNRLAAVFSAVALMLASLARAQPNAANSILGVGISPPRNGSIRLGGVNPSGLIPTYVTQSGYGLGVVPAGPLSTGYTVEVRDNFNNPMAGLPVWIDFSSCVTSAGGDILLSSDQHVAVTGQTLMPSYSVAGTTNAVGQFTFYVIGAAYSSTLLLPPNAVTPGFNCAPAPVNCTNAGCANVWADGVLLSATPLRVTAWDINADGSPTDALTGKDVATVSFEVVRSPFSGARQRTDLDRDGRVAGSDVALMADAVVANVAIAIANTAPYIP